MINDIQGSIKAAQFPYLRKMKYKNYIKEKKC